MPDSSTPLLQKPVLRPLALLAALAAAYALAQTTTTGGTTGTGTAATTAGGGTEPPLPGTEEQRAQLRRSARSLDDFSRIDILGKLLPVNLTKENIRALLPAIEKARRQEFDTRLLDAKLLAESEAEITKAVEAGIAKGDVPSVEIQNKVRSVSKAISFRRNIAAEEMVDTVYAACERALDAGQMKVMANTLKPEAISPGLKLESDKEKIRFYIRYIFLDELTYDLLLRMSRAA